MGNNILRLLLLIHCFRVRKLPKTLQNAHRLLLFFDTSTHDQTYIYIYIKRGRERVDNAKLRYLTTAPRFLGVAQAVVLLGAYRPVNSSSSIVGNFRTQRRAVADFRGPGHW